MIHVGDIVKIKGSNPTESPMRVVRVDSDSHVATLRYLGGTSEFCAWTANLFRITCPH